MTGAAARKHGLPVDEGNAQGQRKGHRRLTPKQIGNEIWVGSV